MEIKYALTSCDSNPLYLDFWPIISKIWKKYMKIEPILIFIGENFPEYARSEYGQIINLPPVEGLPISTQTQFIRLWYTQFLDGITITTDIDMIPLSYRYFHSMKNIKDDKFIVLGFLKTGFSICYNIAHPKIFKEKLSLSENMKNDIYPYFLKLKEKNNNSEWFSDEVYLTEHLEYASDIIRFDRGDNPWLTRIDRSNWNFNPELIKLGVYYDCHSLRPYKKYKSQIDQIIKLFP